MRNSEKTQAGERKGLPAMRKDELLKADLLSEVVLIVSGVAILVTLGIVVVAALTSAAGTM